MVEGVGEHTLAAADEEALDATKQEEWRAAAIHQRAWWWCRWGTKRE
jgi:hypothetical protein